MKRLIAALLALGLLLAALPVYADTEYGYVPLGMDNYARYIDIQQECYIPDGYPDPFQITYTVYVGLRAAGEPVGVAVTFVEYGKVFAPVSGYAQASYKSEPIRGGNSTKSSIWAIADAQIDAMLTGNVAPKPTAVEGLIRMDKAAADSINEQDYQAAINRVESAETVSAIDAAIAVLERLASVNYSDSAKQLVAARRKRSEILRQQQADAEEAKRQQNAEYYAAAQASIEAGDLDAAIEALQAIDGEYEDSAELLTQCENQMRENRYREAEALVENGKHEAAIEAFAALAEEGYADSAERLAETYYLYGEALYADGNYKKAIAAFERAGTYSDAAALVKACKYALGDQAFAKGDFEQAIEYFSEIEEYEDSQERLKECHYLNAQNAIAAGDFEKAAAELEEAGDYRDAQAIAEKLDTVKFVRTANNVVPFKAAGYALANGCLLCATDGSIMAPTDEDASYLSFSGDEFIWMQTGENKAATYTLLDFDGNIIMSNMSKGDYNYILADGSVVVPNNLEILRPDGTTVKLSKDYNYLGVIGGSFIQIRSKKGDNKNDTGVMDSNGKVIVKPQYHDVNASNGYFVATKVTSKSGNKTVSQSILLYQNGKQVFKAGKYTDISPLMENVILVTNRQKDDSFSIKVVNEKGQTLIDFGITEPKNISRNGGYIVDIMETESVVYDQEFNEILSGPWTNVIVIQDTVAAVQGGSGWHLVRLDGTRVTEAAYDSIVATRYSAYIWARMGGQWYVLDLQGNIVY